jgi:hypothetical protein
MSFDADQRAALAALADVLIPAGDGFPSASEAGVASEGLDQVISFQPGIEAGLMNVLEQSKTRPPVEAVVELQKNHPAAFGVLAEFVAGAYFLNPVVRARLGYAGQGPVPISPHPDYLDDGLLQSVLSRGPVYRPTPGTKRGSQGL